MGQQVRHPGAEVGEEEKDNSDGSHEKADHPAGGFQDQAEGDGTHNYIHPDIGTDNQAKQNQQPVDNHENIHPVFSCSFDRRIEGKNQDHDQYQVDRTLVNGGQW